MSKQHLIVFDTTLRDGEQSPGASMNKDEKVRIALMLEKMRVDVIEAGFAIASEGDFLAVKAVAEAVKDSTICSLARAMEADISRAAEAIKPANSGRIHTFIATSPIHMKYKLQMQPDLDLLKPEYNLPIGINYLAGLIQRYDNNPVLAAAAYNAGPTKANAWQTSLGKEIDPLWVERITYAETRDYVKSLLAFREVYAWRLKQEALTQASFSR